MRCYAFILFILSFLLLPVVTIAEITEVGSCDTPGRAMGVYIQGDYAYIAAYTSGLTVIDISDPENPEVVTSYSWDSPIANAVYVEGDIAYIADDRNKFISLDISDLDNIRELDLLDTEDDAFSIGVNGDIACVACDSYDLMLFDISDPDNMHMISNLRIDDSSRRLFVEGNIVYIGQDGQGLYIVDISDPDNPDIIGSLNLNGLTYSVCVSGDYAYVTDYSDGLKVVDISNPDEPEIVGVSDVVSVFCVTVQDDYAFMDNYNNSTLSVVDVSNPEEPETVESYNNQDRLQDIKIVDNYAYIANYNSGFLILDVSEYTCTGPQIRLSDDELDFERVGLELTRELQLTITNTGIEDLVIPDISVEGNYFSADFEDEITLRPDEDMDLTVWFTPEEKGEFEATMTITSNDERHQEIDVAMSGEGVGALCWFNPSELEFGVVGIDMSSEETINFRNRGLIDLVISDLSNENEAFTYDFEDDITIEPGEYSAITVTFAPTDGINYEDTLRFSTNDPEKETVVIPMSGRGMGALIVADPDTVQFGEVGMNRSAERVVTISNEGEINLEISEIFVEGRFFSIDLDSIYVAEPEGSIQCTVTFAPEEFGDFRAMLFISNNDRQNEEFIIPLFGVGKGPEVAVDTDSLDFGLISCNNNKEIILTISAVGLTDLTVTGVTVQGAPIFESFLEEEVFIELNQSFELPVSYNPCDDCLSSGILTIHSDDPENGEYNVPLIGTAHRGIMIDTLGVISDLTVVNDYTYLAMQNGLVVLDVSNPEVPSVAGNYESEGLNAQSINIIGDFAYIATGETGFTIIDISVVDSIKLLSTYDTEGYVRDIKYRDEYAFVADGESGLRVIDLYDLERPAEVSHVDTPGEAYGVTLDGDYAYVADYVQGLRIIDISDPQEPIEVGYFNTRGWSYDIAVSGSIAYVADERYGLRIIDVSDPENPDEIGFYDTEGDAFGVQIVEDHAYVADGSGGMYMLDISIPESPCPAKVFYTPGTARSVEVIGNYAFIADHGDILIIDISEFLPVDELVKAKIPTGFILQPAFPNPFNSTTTITYGLSMATPTRIAIYDLTGREIVTLINDNVEAGYYNVVWNAAEFPSGLYICRMEAGGFYQSRKLVFVR
ncbi:choice-of-anchor D domain-containing protein [bacterium]|nr:choice-of-anchor D domain-containing protein [bacterium]